MPSSFRSRGGGTACVIEVIDSLISQLLSASLIGTSLPFSVVTTVSC